jgi:diaminopimelate epimerase
MTIPFTKAQAVGNDFLIVEWSALSAEAIDEESLPELAHRICDRHCGVGADGLEVIFQPDQPNVDARLRIFNADGSEAEISGNGTRAVAAFLIAERGAQAPLRVETKAGVKEVRLIERRGKSFSLEMTMGRPAYQDSDIGCSLETEGGRRQVTLLNVGNPQCVVFVTDFDFDWRSLGREIETLPRFPDRTNVSFANVRDRNAMDVRFWERGAGETISSGTGATGAAVAGIVSGQVQTPVRVVTPAGDLNVRWERESEATLVGAAEIIAQGEFYRMSDSA